MQILSSLTAELLIGYSETIVVLKVGFHGHLPTYMLVLLHMNP